LKRVLIVTYYWPPAGGPGVQRWLKFVKYLPEFEIEPIVYIPENPHYPIQDVSLVDEIPDTVTIIKAPIWEPYGLAGIFSKKKTQRISSGIITDKEPGFLERLMLAIRGNLFIPDARKYWVSPSIKRIAKLLKDENIDTVITTGPPHSVHLIGLGLKKQHNIRWIADFRDPWTQIGYHKKLRLTPWAKRKHLKLEKLVLQQADQLIATSKTTSHDLIKKGQAQVLTITNGFDHTHNPDVPKDTKFSLAHIGSLLSGRNPQVLWQAFEELCTENESFSKDLRLNFSGVVGEEIKEDLRKFGLFDKAEFFGYISHDEAVKMQHRSQVLLLLEIDSTETMGIIPGKLFEYWVSKRPILGIGPTGWEVAEMIHSTQSGSVFTPKDKDRIKNVLLNWYSAFTSETGLQTDAVGIAAYARRELTKQLANLLHGDRT